jgi:hypothetical protein
LDRCVQDFFKVDLILNYGKPFILYLNDFSSDSRVFTKGDGLGSDAGSTYHVYGNQKGEQILDSLSRYFSVIGLANISDLTKNKKGNFLLSANGDWFENFKLLVGKARYIVLDYSENFGSTLNIQMELDFLLAVETPIILFATEQVESMARLKYPDLVDKIFYINRVYQMLTVEDLLIYDYLKDKSESTLRDVLEERRGSYYVMLDDDLVDVLIASSENK